MAEELYTHNYQRIMVPMSGGQTQTNFNVSRKPAFLMTSSLIKNPNEDNFYILYVCACVGGRDTVCVCLCRGA